MKLRDAARGAKQETASRRSLTVNILGGRREALSAAVVLYQGSRPASEPTQVAAVARYEVSAGDVRGGLAGWITTLSLDKAALGLAVLGRGRSPIRKV
jgi:hypothetical protein